MCHKIICQKCYRPTWAGCGQHIEECLRDVPYDQRCSCNQPVQSQVQSNQFMRPQYVNNQYGYGYRY